MVQTAFTWCEESNIHMSEFLLNNKKELTNWETKIVMVTNMREKSCVKISRRAHSVHGLGLL